MRTLKKLYRIGSNKLQYSSDERPRHSLARKRGKKSFYIVPNREYVRPGYFEEDYVETYEQYKQRTGMY